MVAGCPRSPRKGPCSNPVCNALGWLQPSSWPPFQLLPLLFADWKPSCERPSSLKAARRMRNHAFQRATSQVPVSFPDMPQNKEKPLATCKDRCGEVGKEVGNPAGWVGEAPTGAADKTWAFSYGLRQILPLVWASLCPSVQWN